MISNLKLPLVNVFVFCIIFISCSPKQQLNQNVNSTPNVSSAKTVVYPFAPGSTNIFAGEKGFIIKQGDFPDSLLQMALESNWRSHDITISSNEYSLSFKTEPVEFQILITDSGYMPPEFKIPKDVGLLELTIINNSSVSHRFGSKAFGTRSVIVLSGENITLPPPIIGFPFVSVLPKSSINISKERSFDHFYIEVPAHSTARITFGGPSGAQWKAVSFFCDLPGHSETMIISAE